MHFNISRYDQYQNQLQGTETYRRNDIIQQPQMQYPQQPFFHHPHSPSIQQSWSPFMTEGSMLQYHQPRQWQY
jgi:hypothetical protein